MTFSNFCIGKKKSLFQMSRTRPYPKRPSSQFAAPAFYWRGGDVHREREYLADEYKKALADYRKAELEYKEVEKTLSEASETLQEREAISDTLANYLDQDSEGNQTEHNIKKQLSEIEKEIKQKEVELQQARAVHHPAVTSGLQKEKAYLQLETQRVTKAIELAREQQANDRRKLAELSISKKYQQALDVEEKNLELSKKRQYLRQLVNKTKKGFDSTKPVIGGPTSTDAKNEKQALLSQSEAEQSLARAEEKKKRRPQKWNMRIDRILSQLEDLNNIMYDLDIKSYAVDIDSLRQKYQGSDESKKNNEEEEDKAEE